LQDKHCDDTRGTAKRFRVLRNVGMAAPYFPVGEPVICFGSGDGLELEVWRLLGYAVTGVEISERKRAIANAHGCFTVDVLQGRGNIYCAHTLEHVPDVGRVLALFRQTCISTICCIVPLEPDGSRNPSHLAPIRRLDDVRIEGMEVLLKMERWNDEREGVVICRS